MKRNNSQAEFRKVIRQVNREFGNPRTKPVDCSREPDISAEEASLRWEEWENSVREGNDLIPLVRVVGEPELPIERTAEFLESLKLLVERARFLRGFYPLKWHLALAVQLQREHAGRYCALVLDGITDLREDEKYVLDLEDDGRILEDIPWAVLRYRFDGNLVSRQHYLELKREIKCANLNDCEAVILFLGDLLERYRVKLLVAEGQPERLRNDKQWTFYAQDIALWSLLNTLIGPRNPWNPARGALIAE